AAAPEVDLGIDDLHRMLSSRCVPSALGAVLVRQGPRVHDPELLPLKCTTALDYHSIRCGLWEPHGLPGQQFPRALLLVPDHQDADLDRGGFPVTFGFTR